MSPVKVCLESEHTGIGDLSNLVTIVAIPEPMSVIVLFNDIDKSCSPTTARSRFHELYLCQHPVLHMTEKSTDIDDGIRLFHSQCSGSWLRKMSTYILEVDESIPNTAKAKD